MTQTKYALSAYGPQNQVLAQSYDSGKTWKQTKAGLAFNTRTPEPQVYTRRVAAIADAYTPSSARRIETPFLRLAEVGVLAGVLPFHEAVKMGDDQMDGLICPGLCPEELLPELRRVSRSLLLDLDAPTVWTEESRQLFDATVRAYDAVLVPTSLLASRIRPYHDRVFVMPHLLREDLWGKLPPRKARPQVTIGVPTVLDETLSIVMATLTAHFGDRIQIKGFDWQPQFPGDEALLYPEFDVVVLPVLPDRYQASLAPLLPAMAASCLVIGDRVWSGLRHNETGLTITRHSVQAWLNELRRAITDSRLRQRLGRNARAFALRQTTQLHRAEIYLPYRLVVPEGPAQRFA